MQLKNFTFLLFFLLPAVLFSQENDECINATRLENVNNYCSESREFTNTSATTSSEESPTCFLDPTFFDVWFVFTAEATAVSIAVRGNEAANSGGSLTIPQFALYTGPCDNLQEIQCSAAMGLANTTQSITNNLLIGEEYYIRVSANSQRRGTFQLCVNNFNEVPSPSSDCNSGVVLCDKSPFFVESILSAGDDPNEITDITCRGGAVTEDQSTWFKWVCENPGTLEFDIQPVDPDDDLDFVLYELPNGLNDCGGKNPLRIMLSGENRGAPVAEWEDCIGDTGMRAGDDDEREDCGCQTGDDDNYVRPIDMVAGRAYALVILNFTESGNGFNIEFGGTGTFRGPAVDFTTNLIDLGQTTACVGQEIQITDASFFEGGLTDWNWQFGVNASIRSSDGQGPHNVSFNRPGIQNILLSVTSVDGCIKSDFVQVEVVCCEDHFSVDATITNTSCPDATDGAIDLMATSDFGITDISWDTGSSEEDIDNLARGPYEVLITDNATCSIRRTFEVGAPDTFNITPLITMPTCDGGTDGAINLEVLGARPPYQFDWDGQGFIPDDNTLDNLPTGDYTVRIRDDNNCIVERVIPVRELELILDPVVTQINPPACTDFNNGNIEVFISNGQGPYEYDWQDGLGFQDDNTLVNIVDGTYSLQVRDANRCLGNFEFEIVDPAPVDIAFDIDPVSCFGESDATVRAIGQGGTGTYLYSWNSGSNSPTLTNLNAGQYALTISDTNGCLKDTIFDLGQPDTIFFNNIQVEDVLCFGESSGQITILGGGGTPPYDFRLIGQDFIPENTFLNLRAGSYTVELKDAEGCAIRSTVEVTEPPLLTVDAGDGEVIELGEQILIEATPSAMPVTYLWTPEESLNCFDCQSPLAQPFNSTTYRVVVTDPVGCMAEDQVTITVAKTRRIYTPTAFSPNNDGNNDFFTIYGDNSATRIVSLKIFDRWGELLFEEEDLPLGQEALGWDGNFRGKPMNGGVYIYLAEIEFLDEKVVVERGDVLLVR